MTTPLRGREPASQWVQRWSHLVTPRGTVLDVACGHGRHLRWFAGRGHAVVGVDRDPQAPDSVADLVASGRAQAITADIENGPWPLMVQAQPWQFDAVVVVHYLWRPLLPTILQSLAVNGVLLYETFAAGNASVGKPSRPDFLLLRGELLRVCVGLNIVAYEDGFIDNPARFVQRIAAIRTPSDPPADAAGTVTPPRFTL